MTNYFVLTKDKKESNGLWLLRLEAFVNGKKVGEMPCYSGLAYYKGKYAQIFTTKAKEVKQMAHPIPEAVYNLSQIHWKAGWDNYNSLFSGILSPFYVWIDPEQVPNRQLLFHWDHPKSVLGTLGCIGFRLKETCEIFTGLIKNYGHFSTLYVDYGLGTVNLPEFLDELESKDPSQHPIEIGLFNGSKVPYVNIDGSTWVRSTDSAKAVDMEATWDQDREHKLIIE